MSLVWFAGLVAGAAVGCGVEKGALDLPDAGAPGTGGSMVVTPDGAAGAAGQTGAGGGPSPTTGAGGMAGTDGGTPGTGGAAPAGSGGAAGGGSGGAAGGAGGAAGGPGGTGGGDPRSCSDLFDPNQLHVYSLEISDAEWASLTEEFLDIQSVLAGTPRENYHPIVFHYGAETVTNAMIRLKGQSSWVQTVMLDPNPKMQFVVSFEEVNPDTKLHGVSKIVFDMPRSDWTFVGERVATSWMREIGIPAPCASSGTLTINGAFYGLYVTEESKGGRMLKQFFPGNSDGDFLKSGTVPDGNDGIKDRARRAQFWAVSDIASLRQIVDVPNTLLEWAAEAVLNDGDGYYGGSHNFYIYDQGAAGYVFTPTDLDSTFAFMEIFTTIKERQHPIFWWEGRGYADSHGQHYLVAMNDPDTRRAYVDAIDTQLGKYDVAKLRGWLDAWSQQVAGAVAMDTRKWATMAQFDDAIHESKEALSRRGTFLRDFVSCSRGSGATSDADGDGVPWCNDCRDGDPAVSPGLPEVCGNAVDDNCDGVVDEGCPTTPPPPPPAPAM